MGINEEGNILRTQQIGLLGQTSSFLSAFNVAQVCLTWFVFTFTGSALDVGLVAIVESVSVLLVSLPVGTLVDRLNKGSLLVVSGVGGFSVFLFLALYTYFLPFELLVVLVLAAVWGATREVSRSTNLAAPPEIVRGEDLSRFNGIYRAVSSSIGSISNALAGGIIVTLGIISGFLFSSGAYLLSALFAFTTLYPFMKHRRKEMQAHAGDNKGSMFTDIKEGFIWLVGMKGFFLLTISAMFFNFFMDMAVTYFVVYVAIGLTATSLIFGFILSAYAAGDVIGSLLGGRLRVLRHSGKINVVLYGGVPGVCMLIIGIFPVALLAILFTFVAGLCLGLSINVWLTTAHNVVPPGMRGRYFALDGVMSSITPAAIAAGAVAISTLGVVREFALSGILMIIFTVVFAAMKSLWTLDGRSQANIDAEKPA